MTHAKIKIDSASITEFCRCHGVRRLSLYGSVLREDFDEHSDVDVLVEFLPARVPGFFGLTRMEAELSELFNWKVDLNTPGFLSPHFRQQVLAEAEVYYDAA